MVNDAIISSYSIAKPSRLPDENQDMCLASSELLRPHERSVLAVADGVSNSSNPRSAAEGAITSVKHWFLNSTSHDLKHLIVEAQSCVSLIESIASDPHPPATTLVVAEVTTLRVRIISVGDSRAYSLHDGNLKQITTDDTVAEDLVQQGLLSRKESTDHPMGNALTKAISSRFDLSSEIEVHEFQPSNGQVLILCSDGIYAGLNSEDFKQLVSKMPEKDAARYLAQAAIDRQVNDDITAVVAIFRK